MHTLSVIVPFFNEVENLPILHKELLNVLKKEVGRTKGSIPTKVIEFKKNFGQTAAVVAGIDNVDGKYVSFLDADLQNDPHDIPRFMQKLNEGYDAVFGWRKERKDTNLRSFLSRMANTIINVVFAYPYHDVGCSARIVKKEYLNNLQLYGELHRIMPVLIYLKGAKIGEIVVTHRARKAGKSKYGFERIVKTIIDIITVKFLTSYGTRPAYV